MVKQYVKKIITEVSNAFSLLSLYVSAFSTMEIDVSVMSPLANSVITLIDELCQFFTKINATEGDLKKILKPNFIVESTHPYIYEIRDPVKITCKGAETFTVNYSYSSKFPPMEFLRTIRLVDPSNGNDLLRISNDTSSLNNQIIVVRDELDVIFEYTDIKKNKLEYLLGNPALDCYGYRLDIVPNFGKSLLNLNEYLDQILRSCSWLIGRFSYNLIRIKKIDKESDEEKNYKLLLHSKIFSGGFENRFLHLFSKRTIKRL